MRAWIDFPQSEDAPGRWRARFTEPIQVLTAWKAGEVQDVLRQAQAHAEAGRWCLGAVAYEAAGAFDAALPTHAPQPGWPLARFAVFDRALPWHEAQASADGGQCTSWHFSMQRDTYARQLERARDAMAAGECYQVNLTGSLQAEFSGDVGQWMARLQAAQPQAYLLWLDWGEQQVLSASPELFFDWRPGSAGGALVCQPMKGTAARHAGAAEDERARQGLLASAKERAENVMIVDLLRNDLGRIAQPGSVRVPRLFEAQALPTVWQMTSTVTATTRPRTGLAEVFGALFPCGSVTGAPKGRAMHWIRELEDGPRGIYCGAAGVLRPGGHATFNVPIRTVALERMAAHGAPSWSARYGVGSGITHDATAQAEWQELAAKSRLPERTGQSLELLETLRLEHGHYWLLEEHLARMATSAAYFAFAWDRAQVEALLQSLAREHSGGAWRIRLTLAASGKAGAQAFTLPATAEPVLFALSRQPLDTQAGNREFVLHKTTQREHYETRLRPESGLFDTLLVNERGELTEFTRGNIALKLDGRWLTPALRCGLLAGTYRGQLLARGELVEAVLMPADLERAEAVAFYNSVRGWLRAQLSQC
ncbi:chorismate-binding protein [Ramlibacter sp. WS9]|uniref:chorismate-binding protein n=1 Tax=Ramlibacter sp. WS9 TaxID=1882741 RepID=UPI00114416CF|nr:chorismate-binding protein [Ramlibacter sp. WS9]ROZ78226.1 bifunctional aminodeoxychorismate synthase component I/aminotransferase [Ramlibacter sp. WS9]